MVLVLQETVAVLEEKSLPVMIIGDISMKNTESHIVSYLIRTNGKLDYLDKAYRDANVALQVFTQRYDECGNEKLVISMDHIVYTQALILCHKCFINDYSDISANTFAIHTLHTALNSPYNTYSFAKTDSFNYQSVVEKIVYATIANKGLVHPEAYGWLQDLFRLISETE